MLNLLAMQGICRYGSMAWEEGIQNLEVLRTKNRRASPISGAWRSLIYIQSPKGDDIAGAGLEPATSGL